MRGGYKPSRDPYVRRPREKAYVPEPWSQGPHAHAVHDAGGKLIGVPLNRERFNAHVSAHAPGCGAPVPSVGPFPAEGICCGQLGPDNQPVLCPLCRPQESAQAVVAKLLETDPDDPASAMQSIVPAVRAGSVTIWDGEATITRVRSRDGVHVGVPTGTKKQCSSWCDGERFGVRWGDGKLTWICTGAIQVEGETAILL